MPFFNLITNAIQSRSLASSAQNMVNLYPEIEREGDETRITLYSAPGKSLYATVGSGPIRAIRPFGGHTYIVSGNEVYRHNDAVTTLLGAINTSTGNVSMTNNDTQVLIVDGTNGYFAGITGLTQIADADFPNGVTWCDYIDGWFIVGGDGTQKFYKSSLLDGSSWDALDFASAEGSPDSLPMGIVSNREIILIGQVSSEFWIDTGALDFPFERTGNAFIEYGVLAPFSVAKNGQAVFWLSNSERGRGMVLMLNGYTPVKISTFAIENSIKKWPNPEDATAYIYIHGGHSFYVLSSVSGNQTFVYDVSTGIWHQRAHFYDGEFYVDRGGCYAFYAGQHLLGDRENGNIYQLDDDVYADYDEELCRELTGRHIRGEKRTFYGEFEVIMETGRGLEEGQGGDPQMVLSTSKDQGRTWSSDREKSIGAMGEYETRVCWKSNGSGFNKTFRIRITDPVFVAMSMARVEYSA